MGAPIDLVEDEKILFEGEPVILTNRRLLRKKRRSEGGPPWDESPLRNVASFKKVSGGQESHLKDGLTFGGAGVVLMGLTFILTDAPRLIGLLVFVGGSLGILIGAYLLLRTLSQMRPHTAVWFDVLNEDGTRKQDVPIYFPRRDNPKADELTRRFARARRGL